MQGTAFKDIKGDFYYPSIGMKKPNEHIKANFGQTPFVFDIEGMIEVFLIQYIKHKSILTLLSASESK